MAQALIKYQGVFGNFPMRLRWLFPACMLQQSLSFFGDEFAGRISTKVMQTALAVRDTWFIVADILVYVIVYFGTLVGVVASFDTWLIAPLPAGCCSISAPSSASCRVWARWANCRPMRSLMTGPHHRRLYQHRHRQALCSTAGAKPATRARPYRSS